MNKLVVGYVVWFLLALVAGCSELNQDVPPAGGTLRLHGTGWTDPTSSYFHGKAVRRVNGNVNECLNCHGADFDGGTSRISCIHCHQAVDATWHGSGWLDSSSTNFHGKIIRISNGNVSDCLQCHGSNFDGGTSGISCIDCHQSEGATWHGTGWLSPSSPNFHGEAIKDAGWDMSGCKTCHGSSYEGGTSGVSCLTCHNNLTGPENCTTCHGGSTGPAPPKDLDDNTSPTARGVGAHQKHYIGGGIYSNYTTPCSDCHNVPPSLYSPGHIDSPKPAEVVIGGWLAQADTNDVVGRPTYIVSSLSCSNTFCHGNFSLDSASSPNQFIYTSNKIQGANRTVLWVGGSAETACSSCHGLPPSGHLEATINECGGCHLGITNSSGQITDKAKHINGKVNVFGIERNF
jgi:hypothetical protein